VAGAAAGLGPDRRSRSVLARGRGRGRGLRGLPDVACKRFPRPGERRERALELRLVRDDPQELGRRVVLEREQADDIGVQAARLGGPRDRAHSPERGGDPVAREGELVDFIGGVAGELEVAEGLVDLARRADEPGLRTVDAVDVRVHRVAALVRVASAAAAREDEGGDHDDAAAREAQGYLSSSTVETLPSACVQTSSTSPLPGANHASRVPLP
jgi:hypothetical protein